MGKKNYIHYDISSPKTSDLAQDELLVLENEGDANNYFAVHSRYFSKEKICCPSCGSLRTRCSKIVKRTFKDIIEHDGQFRIVDLHFYQRYFRCDNCLKSVFPEPISFGEKSVRYSNRLADKLAEGTFQHSYKKVCAYYGVPASTASVGAIMRRQIMARESRLYPIKTPHTISIVEVDFCGNYYPVIFSSVGANTYCLEVLKESTASAYINFFNTLNATQAKTVCIDPNESIQMAVAACFPQADMVVTDECILRHARRALLEVIYVEGKRLPLQHKYDRLILHAKHLRDSRMRKQIGDVLKNRPKLKAAYEHYQKLLDLLEVDWNYESLADWAHSTPTELDAFADVCDVIEIYEAEIRKFLSTLQRMPESYHSAIKSVFDAIRDMPHCIFDVLRARCLLTVEHDNINESGKILRLGVPVNRMIQKINTISSNIREEKEYGLER